MTGTTHADVAIAGGGHAGGATAQALREMGFSGSIVVLAKETHLPYERPPLSKEALSDPAFSLAVMASSDEWRNLGVETVLGDPVVQADRQARTVTLASGHTLHWNYLVLALGARPRRLPGASHPARHAIRSIGDAMRIRSRVRSKSRIAIIGGGPIGLEAAASLRPLVRNVTVVEAAPRLMTRCAPADISQEIVALHARSGVTILTGCPVVRLVPDGESLAVVLGVQRMVEADLVIEGIGIVPETELAVSLGLACPDGVTVDAGYATDDPQIFAVGDVACPPGGRQETWAHAESSARAAARSIMGLRSEPMPTPSFWSDQFGSRLQIAGRPHGFDAMTSRGAARLYLRNGIVEAVAALAAPRDFAAARRLIGQPAPDQAHQRPPIASVTLRHPS